MRFRTPWFGRNYWPFLCGASVGVLIAFPLAAPLMDGKILEPVATMWGSALGAIAAVAGAFWVAERQVSMQRRAAAALVHQMFHPVAFALDELAFVYSPPSRPTRGDNDDEPDMLSIEKWGEIADHAQLVLDQYKKFNDKIHRYEAGLNLLSATSLKTALALETELADAIHDSVERLTYRPLSDDGPIAVLTAKSPTWSSRFALMVFNRHVQQHMVQLERAAS